MVESQQSNLQQFIAITNEKNEFKVKQYLTKAKGNLNEAVNMFF